MILTYREIVLEASGQVNVEVDDFYRQMHELKHKRVVYLDNYDSNDPEQAVITFIGYSEDVIKFAIPILIKFNYPFEVFINEKFLENNDVCYKAGSVLVSDLPEKLRMIIVARGRVQWYVDDSKNDGCNLDGRSSVQGLEVQKLVRELGNNCLRWVAYQSGEQRAIEFQKLNSHLDKSSLANHISTPGMQNLAGVIVENKTTFRKNSITVIIPSYNYGSFLAEAVESVLRQTIPPDEVLIMDDHSSDNTQDVAISLIKKHPEIIRFHRNETNLGIVKNFNKAVSLTTGNFICFLGADNRFRSDYLEKTSEVLNEDDSIAIAYTDFALFGPRAQVVYDDFLETRKGPIIHNCYYIIKFPEFCSDELKRGNFIHGSSMYRRKAFEQVGGYIDKSNTPEDYNLFYRMVTQGWKAKHIPLPLLEYRQHSDEQANIKMTINAQLIYYKQITKDRDKDIAELKGVIDHRDRDIAELKGVIDHRDRDIAELKGAIDHRDRDIAELKGVIDHRDRDIAELKKLIKDISKKARHK